MPENDPRKRLRGKQPEIEPETKNRFTMEQRDKLQDSRIKVAGKIGEAQAHIMSRTGVRNIPEYETFDELMRIAFPENRPLTEKQKKVKDELERISGKKKSKYQRYNDINKAGPGEMP